MQVKEFIKKTIGYKRLHKYHYAKKISSLNNSGLLSTYSKVKVYTSYEDLVNNLELKEISSKYFYYYIDVNKTYYSKGTVIGNLMVDYSMILDKSINDYKEDIKQIKDVNFYNKELDVVNAFELLVNKELEIVKSKNIKNNLEGLLNRKANSFVDALQRIMVLNQLLWQSGIYLNGIGRLDLILDSYYKNDIKNKKITKEEARKVLKEFLIILHKDYYFKSNTLYGDTGQIIILGGLLENGKYFTNDLTYMIIELLEELKEPDPKVLLRVSKSIPRDLMDTSLKCISTGIGCPLFANDDVIINRLLDFGYAKEDAYNYGTAACWEPYIPGKSLDQNNIKTINYMIPLNDMLNNSKATNMKQLKEEYFKHLKKYLDEFRNCVDSIEFAENPLLSLFNKNCVESSKDIANGGAIYNNYGFTSVGLANLVNSLYAIDKLVFKDKKYKLDEFVGIINSNFKSNELLIKEIHNEEDKYGVDKEGIILLTNEIIKEVSKYFCDKTNKYGGRYKFGLSAPSYITDSESFPASPDGRKNGEPFSVHISNDKANGYTELVNFASQLDYSDNRFNGNVIDFFVTPIFINDNYEKFLDFLISSIKNGFFEMQMNVVSSKILIEARKNPDKFPNLIVRVWGFSAYFKDLPDEYKDYIIERALKNEGNY